MRPNGERVPLADVKADIEQQFHTHSEQGLRVLGIARRERLSRDTPSVP